MRLVGRPVHTLRFRLFVRRPDIADVERRDDDALQIAQGDPVAALYALGKLLADVQRNRDGPEHPRRQPHRSHDLVVVVPVEEAFERREGAVQQQFDIAKLAFGQVPGRELARRLFLGFGVLRRQVEIFQFAAVRLFISAHYYFFQLVEPGAG